MRSFFPIVLAGQAHGNLQDGSESATLLQRRSTAVGSSSGGEVETLNHQRARIRSHAADLQFVETLAQSALDSSLAIDELAKQALQAMNATLENSLGLLLDNHDGDQELLDSIASRAEKCLQDFNTAGTDNQLAATTLHTVELSHSTCRDTLAGQVSDRDQKCKDLTTFLEQLPKPGCQIPAEGEMQAFWDAHNSYSDNYYSNWQTKNSACVASRGNVSDTEGTCDQHQTDYETGLCALRLSILSTCSEYRSCQQLAASDFSAANESTTLGMHNREVEWIAITKIRCYIGVLLNEAELTLDALQECRDKEPSLEQLGLTVPTLPEQVPCDFSTINPYPCTDDFVTTKYADMGGLDDCQACPALPSHLVGMIDGVVDPGTQPPSSGACPHKPEWQYVLEYKDDRETDDIPDEIADIAAGFKRDNAFFIGNEELSELDIKEAQVCYYSTVPNCEGHCTTLYNRDNPEAAQETIPSTNSLKNNLDNADSLTQQVALVIAYLSGQGKNGYSFISKMDGLWGCPNYANGRRESMQSSAADWNPGWHHHGYGITMRNRGHQSPQNYVSGRTYPDPTGPTPFWEFGWYFHDNACNDGAQMSAIDVLQVRVKTA